MAPTRIFKAEHSLYFPNINGTTLEKGPTANRDTTPVLRGRISIVTVFSSTWAEGQVGTFVAEKANPDLHRVIRQHTYTDARARDPTIHMPQIVRVNIETNPARAWIVRAFFWSLRRHFDRSDWGRYFLVTKGLTDDIREATGILNGAVGYVFVVDESCRIRWAGSGDATDEERQNLVNAVARLVSPQ